MPKIAEIEDTPNPNAVKFILREPLTWGITRSYDNAEQAQDGEADWPELVRKVAEPIRAAPRRRRIRKQLPQLLRRPLQSPA